MPSPTIVKDNLLVSSATFSYSQNKSIAFFIDKYFSESNRDTIKNLFIPIYPVIAYIIFKINTIPFN